MNMNTETYKKVCENLLQTHYGIELNDTRLCEDHVVKHFKSYAIQPFEAVNEHAQDHDIVRIDLGGAPVTDILASHQASAIERLADLADLADTIAAKNARMSWAVLKYGEGFRLNKSAA